jgi:hypothetical protein
MRHITKRGYFGRQIALGRVRKDMPILKITEQGLRTIAVLVAILWGCIVAEHSMVVHARNETYRALERMRGLRMRRETIPAKAPVPPYLRGPGRPVAG